MSSMPEVGSFIFQFDRVMFVYDEDEAMTAERHWSFISPHWRAATRDEVCDWHNQKRTLRRPMRINRIEGPTRAAG